MNKSFFTKMKEIVDYYGIFFFSTFIIILSILFICFHKYYKSILQSIFKIERKSDTNLFFFSILFIYFVLIYIVLHCKKYIYDSSLNYYNLYEERPLYDTLHNIIPYHQYSVYFSETIMIFFVILFIYLLYKSRNISILYNFLIIFAIIHIIRSILFSLTLLPDASNNCTFSLFVGSCNDLLFSGHISGALLILLFIYKYKLIHSKVIKNSFILLFILMNVFILSSRNHYSIDIVTALIITYMIYHFYFLYGEKQIVTFFN